MKLQTYHWAIVREDGKAVRCSKKFTHQGDCVRDWLKSKIAKPVVMVITPGKLGAFTR